MVGFNPLLHVPSLLMSNNMNDRSLQTPGAICPFPLIDGDPTDTNFIEDLVEQGLACSFQCTGTMVTQEDLGVYNLLETALSGVGMFCAIFLVSTWGLFSVKQKQKMTFWLSICSLFVTSGIFISALAEGTPEKVWCKNNKEGFKQTDGLTWCLIQGIIFIFFGLGLCCWWFCSCFDIFSKLYLKKRNIEGYLKYYHYFSWGLPLINTVVLLATNSFGFEQPRLWCFLGSDAPDSFELIFFYGWVGFLWIFGTILMLLVIWSVLSNNNKYRNNNRGGNSYLKKLFLYKQPILFVFIFSIFWAVFFSFRVITNIDEKEYIASAKAWVGCLIQGKFIFGAPFPHNTTTGATQLLSPPGEEGQQGCGEKQTGGIPLGLLTIATITISSNSIFLFIIFGIQKENFVLWKDYILSFCQKKKQTTTTTTTANISTFKEMKYNIVYIFRLLFYYISCQKDQVEEIKNNNKQLQLQKPKSPRLKFDQPVYNQQQNLTTNYTPRYFLNNQNSQTNQVGFNSNTSLNNKQDGNYDPNNNNNNEFPDENKQPNHRDNRLGSTWSDAYDDPLWGINVEF